MLNLDSPGWASLQHAYGSAHDIPALLRKLESFPPEEGNAEPWFSLWSALAHQGDVYSASFAAVPHIIQILSIAPERATYSFFSLPAWVEICRFRNKVAVPPELLDPYLRSLGRFPELVGRAASRDCDEDFLRALLSAIAVSKKFPTVAEAAQELTPAVADEFLAWFHDS